VNVAAVFVNIHTCQKVKKNTLTKSSTVAFFLGQYMVSQGHRFHKAMAFKDTKEYTNPDHDQDRPRRRHRPIDNGTLEEISRGVVGSVLQECFSVSSFNKTRPSSFYIPFEIHSNIFDTTYRLI
jgi:hypothetical protein